MSDFQFIIQGKIWKLKENYKKAQIIIVTAAFKKKILDGIIASEVITLKM